MSNGPLLPAWLLASCLTPTTCFAATLPTAPQDTGLMTGSCLSLGANATFTAFLPLPPNITSLNRLPLSTSFYMKYQLSIDALLSDSYHTECGLDNYQLFLFVAAKGRKATIVVRVGNNRPDLGVNPICNRFTGIIEEGRPLFLPCNPPMPGQNTL